ncbi:MAG: rod shape-determining protein MreC [Caulobacteraceae bacterium]
MSLRDGPFGDLKTPLRWTAGLALIAALGLTIFVVSESARAGWAGVAQARRAAASAAGSAGEVLSAPVRWAGEASGSVHAYLMAGSQNRALRAELVQAESWRDKAVELAEVNARYRALLGVKTDPPIPMVFARTVLDARGPFNNTRLADVGSLRGVEEGNPVLSEHGLVGRVMAVAPSVSRILLLTDVESKVPVLFPRTNARAILTGDGGPNPRLDYVRSHDPLHNGDLVLTSGDGGVFPRGVPVGVAFQGYDGSWRVALDSDAAPIDFVQILLFKSFAQLIPPAGLAPGPMPSTATEAPSPPDAIASGLPGGSPGAAAPKTPTAPANAKAAKPQGASPKQALSAKSATNKAPKPPTKTIAKSAKPATKAKAHPAPTSLKPASKTGPRSKSKAGSKSARKSVPKTAPRGGDEAKLQASTAGADAGEGP